MSPEEVRNMDYYDFIVHLELCLVHDSEERKIREEMLATQK